MRVESGRRTQSQVRLWVGSGLAIGALTDGGVFVVAEVGDEGADPKFDPEVKHFYEPGGFVAAHGGRDRCIADEGVFAEKAELADEVAVLGDVKRFVESARGDEMFFPAEDDTGASFVEAQAVLGVFDEVHQLVGRTGNVGATFEGTRCEFRCELSSNDFEGLRLEQGIRIEESEDPAACGLAAEVACATEAAFRHDDDLIAEFASHFSGAV